MTPGQLISKLDSLWLTLLAWAVVFAVFRHTRADDAYASVRESAFILGVFALLIAAFVRSLRFRKSFPRFAFAVSILPVLSIIVFVLMVLAAYAI